MTGWANTESRAARRRRRIRGETVLETIALAAMRAATVMLMSSLTAWVLINWMAGCGETFQTSTGVYERGECVMVPWAQ